MRTSTASFRDEPNGYKQLSSIHVLFAFALLLSFSKNIVMAPSVWKCQSAVSTIFFDLDNTLINTRKGDKEACDKVCFDLILLIFLV